MKNCRWAKAENCSSGKVEAENFSSGKVEAGGEDKALGRDCTQHQLIKLAGEKEEEREQEKEKDKEKKEKNMPGNQHQLRDAFIYVLAEFVR